MKNSFSHAFVNLNFKPQYLILLFGLLMFQSCSDDCEELACNKDCTVGDIEEWSDNDCACLVISVVTSGCTDETATNYNPDANCDNGSCEFPCPDLGTCNMDCTQGDLEIWNIEECVCEVSEAAIAGCTNETASNYNPEANCEDDSCEFGDVEGCTDSEANNFNPNATVDNGSCIYDRAAFIGNYLATFNCPNSPVLMVISTDSLTFNISEGIDLNNNSGVLVTFTSTALEGISFLGTVDSNNLIIPEIIFESVPFNVLETTIQIDVTASGDLVLESNVLEGQINLEITQENGAILGVDTCDLRAIKQ